MLLRVRGRVGHHARLGPELITELNLNDALWTANAGSAVDSADTFTTSAPATGMVWTGLAGDASPRVVEVSFTRVGGSSFGIYDVSGARALASSSAASATLRVTYTPNVSPLGRIYLRVNTAATITIHSFSVRKYG